MRKKLSLYIVFILLVVVLLTVLCQSSVLTAEEVDPPYIGPETCKTCHTEQYSKWEKTGHALMLITANRARELKYPLPSGISWDDVAYVIGSRWKLRYINTSGYIIT